MTRREDPEHHRICSADSDVDSAGEPISAHVGSGRTRLYRVVLLVTGGLAALCCVSASGFSAKKLPAALRGMVGLQEEGSICDEGKEYWWGLCYDKCSDLTNGEYTHRAGGCKCCKDDGACDEPSRFSVSCEKYSNSPVEPIEKPMLTVPGNCESGEELFSALCYTRCRDVFPDYPYRIGPCHCCDSPGSSCYKDPAHYIANCAALNVGSNKARAVHPPDAVCDSAEDYFSGLCYAKCGILTAGEYSIRSGACSCCSSWPCRDPSSYVEDCGKYNKGVGGEAPHLPPFIDHLEGGEGFNH